MRLIVMSMSRRHGTRSIGLLAITAILFFCGSIYSAEKKVDFDVLIQISGNDLMRYSKNKFTVGAGQKVKLEFKNIGKLPKAAMGHNIVILKKGIDVLDFCNEALKFPNEDYFPKTKKNEVIANTKLLGPGESDIVYFVAPSKGDYDFVCSFPGHFAMMKGKMTVE
ncbi:MAG TPA: azurin [Verrucomicrobiales bacterium]|nr:azurin [Verrucomicrobiales bacterium]